MTTAASRVLVEIDGAIAHVRLNRPEKHNGVDVALIEELIAAAKRLRRDTAIRAVILSGEGPSFCAGLDIKGVMAGGPWKLALAFAPLWKPWANRYQNVSLIWRSLSVPVIAAIHGNCFGAAEAQRLGLVTRVVDDPLAAARALAAEIAQRSPDSVAAGKQLFGEAWGASEWGALAAERRWQRRLIGRKNQRVASARHSAP